MKRLLVSFLGFTLHEFIICLGILSAITFFSIPFYTHFIKRNALEERVNTVKNAIKFSQNQAVLKKKSLILSPLSSDLNWNSGMKLE
jgi:Tfp pilus assembly protein FimT